MLGLRAVTVGAHRGDAEVVNRGPCPGRLADVSAVGDVVGWGLRPSRMARHGGHSHQSGRAAGCRVGSPSNSNRHRPHCWGGGPLSAGTQRVLGSSRRRSAPPTRASGKWSMMPPLVGVLRGGVGLVRREAGPAAQTRRPHQVWDPVEQAGERVGVSGRFVSAYSGRGRSSRWRRSSR